MRSIKQTLCLLAGFGILAGRLSGAPGYSHVESVDELFEQAIEARRQAYVDLRNEIIDRGTAAKAVLQRVCTSPDAVEQLLARAILERMADPQRYQSYEEILSTVISDARYPRRTRSNKSNKVTTALHPTPPTPHVLVRQGVARRFDTGLPPLVDGLGRPLSPEHPIDEPLSKPQAVPFICETAFKNPDGLARYYAIQMIIVLEYPRMQELLAYLLQVDPDSACKTSAGKNITDPAFADVLRDELAKEFALTGDKRLFPRPGSIETGEPPVTPPSHLTPGTPRPAGQRWDYQTADLRRAMAERLGEFKDTESVPLLMDILENDSSVGGVAARALGEIGDARALDVLKRISETSGSSAVAIACGRIDYTVLLPQLSSKNKWVRWAAIRGIPCSREPAALDLIITWLDSSDNKMVESALRGLARPAGKIALDKIVYLATAHESAPVRMRALRTLRAFSSTDETAFHAVLKGLEDEAPFIRKATVEALSRMDDPRVLPALEKVAKDTDAIIAWYARSAVRDIKERARKGKLQGIPEE